MDLAQALQKNINDLVQHRTETLITGQSKDFAEYQRLVGVVEGLRLAERELLELQRNQQEYDEDD